MTLRAAALAASGIACLGALAPLPSRAQPVVQPLPSPAVGALDSALRRLAADPRNVQALVDAGYAALALNDADAAIGFFSRASEIAPQNARAKAGLGSAFVRSENPYDAMLLFEEALRLGATPASLAADRGLASDLVGDAQGAQTFYRQALAAGPNDEISRRLALSLAVSGKRNDMEDVLLPLLKRNDLAAFRTRAFGLAILGDAKEASDIVDVIMPKEMAKRIKPYLKQLPRLTSAQQIAAASFGHFPAEKNIGSDDPRFARYGGGNKVAAAQPASRTADAGLIPAGEPLGAKGKAAAAAKAEKPPTRAEKARAEKAEKAARGQQLAVATQPARTVAPASSARTAPPAPPAPTQELAPVAPRPGFSSLAMPSQPAATPSAAPSTNTRPPAQAAAQLPPVPAPASTTAAVAARPAAAPSTAPSSVNFDLAELPQSRTAQAPVTTAPVPAAPAPATAALAATAAPPAAAAAPAPSQLAPPAAPSAAAVPASAPAATPIYSPAPDPIATYVSQPAAPAPASAPERKFSSVADAFSGFDVATPPVTVLPGAVDLTTIKVAREAPPAAKTDPKAEVEKPAKDAKKETPKEKAAREAKEKAIKEKAEKEKARKANPSRIWVQVGTGRDKTALSFDWRRMNKDDAALFKGRKAYVTAWGQTNRLLTGPFPNDAAAKDFLKKLKAAKYDSFGFTSAEGQEVEVLGASR